MTLMLSERQRKPCDGVVGLDVNIPLTLANSNSQYHQVLCSPFPLFNYNATPKINSNQKNEKEKT